MIFAARRCRHASAAATGALGGARPRSELLGDERAHVIGVEISDHAEKRVARAVVLIVKFLEVLRRHFFDRFLGRRAHREWSFHIQRAAHRLLGEETGIGKALLESRLFTALVLREFVGRKRRVQNDVAHQIENVLRIADKPRRVNRRVARAKRRIGVERGAERIRFGSDLRAGPARRCPREACRR